MVSYRDMIKGLLFPHIKGNHIAVLGFGKEGRSTCRLLGDILPGATVNICDKNEKAAELSGGPDSKLNIRYFLGINYLEGLKGAGVIIRSPGIPFSAFHGYTGSAIIISQTELFLKILKDQVTGVTGSKGKSTTTRLIFEILKRAGKKALLAGNIGIPCFDLIDSVDPGTEIIYEMSSHQLQGLVVSPHIAVLLNIYQEHLDHYASFDEYREAKINIYRWQENDDLLVYNAENKGVVDGMQKIPARSNSVALGRYCSKGVSVCRNGDDLLVSSESTKTLLRNICRNRLIPGEHNLINISAAVAVALNLDVHPNIISSTVADFRGLPHRLEFVGDYSGVSYYNDSISTIPESAIAALKTLPSASTIILGGMDRGVDYVSLIDFLQGSEVVNILLLGNAGKRMLDLIRNRKEFKSRNVMLFESFDMAVSKAVEVTPSGSACLLSPAASSYDSFTDFEERGERFKSLIKDYSGS